MVSGNEWIIVILVVALIFGATRLPLLGRNLGQGIKEFKKGISEARSDKDDGKRGPSGPSDPTVNGTHGPDSTDTGPGPIADRRDRASRPRLVRPTVRLRRPPRTPPAEMPSPEHLAGPRAPLVKSIIALMVAGTVAWFVLYDPALSYATCLYCEGVPPAQR